MKLSEKFTAALQRIRTKKTWCKGADATDYFGGPAAPESEEATQFCARGAFKACRFPDWKKLCTSFLQLVKLEDLPPKLQVEFDHYYQPDFVPHPDYITDLNDSSRMTHSCLVKIWKKVIRRAQATERKRKRARV